MCMIPSAINDDFFQHKNIFNISREGQLPTASSPLCSCLRAPMNWHQLNTS